MLAWTGSADGKHLVLQYLVRCNTKLTTYNYILLYMFLRLCLIWLGLARYANFELFRIIYEVIP